MRSYASLWVIINPYKSLCVLRNLMGPYRSLWVPMGPNGSL